MPCTLTLKILFNTHCGLIQLPCTCIYSSTGILVSFFRSLLITGLFLYPLFFFNIKFRSMNTFINKDTASLPVLITLPEADFSTGPVETVIMPETEIKKTYCAADAWSINNRKRIVRVYPRRA